MSAPVYARVKVLFLLCLFLFASFFVFSNESPLRNETDHVSNMIGASTTTTTYKLHSKLLHSIADKIRKVQDFGIKSDARYIPKYEAGQGGVGVGGGVVFPLFFQTYSGSISSANLSLGGSIWFEWDIFLWKGLSSGMEIGGMYSLTKNERSLFMAPITAHIKYTFQLYPVEFPISLALGANLASIEDDFKADFITKPKLGITYRFNQNWAAGLYASYWFIVQDYGLTLGEEYSRLGNFIDTTAGVAYVF